MKGPRNQPVVNSDRPALAGERLQKVLASAGIASRRECEELIVSGRVEVDGQVVHELGIRVDPERQQIRVDGSPIRPGRRVYYVVNKPVGVVTTNRDPSGRTRVIDLVPSQERLFPVGRLDRTSEGLILVTNDGELANRLTHPRYGVTKIYRAVVAGQPSAELLRRLRTGVHLAEGIARVASVQVRHRELHSTELEIALKEGQNREIRRILARVGHKVLRLRRIAFGSLRLGSLPPGGARRLSVEEVRRLEKETKRPVAETVARPKPPRSRIRRKSVGGGPKGAASPARKQAGPPRSGFGAVIADEFEQHGQRSGSRSAKKPNRRKKP